MTELERFIDRINFIEGITDLEKFTNSEIKSLINFGRVLIGTALLNKGHYVFRIRPNDRPLYYYEGEVSFRKDSYNINKYGRANLPGQSVFYCSTATTKIDLGRATSLFESIKFDNLPDIKEKFITVGAWRIMKNIEVAEIYYHLPYINNNPDLQQSYIFHINLISKLKYVDQIKAHKYNQFISNQFAKDVKGNHENYKISANFADTIYKTHLGGISYPSRQTNGDGLNIALKPSVVQSSLKLEKLLTCKIIKTGEKAFMVDNTYYSDLIDVDGKFIWQEINDVRYRAELSLTNKLQ